MALPADFSKIFGSTATGGLTPISDVNYAKGWEFAGANPPTKNDFSYLQNFSDVKSKWLYDNKLQKSDPFGDIKAAGTEPTARSNLGLKNGATLEVATTAEVAAGIAEKLVSVPGLTSFFDLAATAVNGSIRIPNRPGGIIIAWGTTPANGDGVFVVAFNNPPFVIPQVAGGSGSFTAEHVTVQNVTNTGFSTFNQALPRKYIAIGK